MTYRTQCHCTLETRTATALGTCEREIVVKQTIRKGEYLSCHTGVLGKSCVRKGAAPFGLGVSSLYGYDARTWIQVRDRYESNLLS